MAQQDILATEGNEPKVEPVVETTPPVEPQAPVDTDPYKLIADGETDKGISANPISFAGNVAHEMSNGLSASVSNLISDFSYAHEDTDELFFDLVDTADKLIEQYGFDQFIMDELLGEVNSPEEMERKAKRIHEVKAYNASLEHTSMAQQLFAGLGGFVIDPVNFIPGGVILKAGSAATKVMPKVADSLTRTSLGKTGTYAALGAIEEASRNVPRLMSDPTYSYEMYRMDIMIGSAFGAAMPILAPGAKALGRKAAETVQKSGDAYKVSLQSRMAVNTMTDALRVTKAPKARKEIQDAIDAAIGPDAIHAAKVAAKQERAQVQVDNSQVMITYRDTMEKARTAFDEGGEFNPEELIRDFAEELKDSSPTFSKLFEAIKTSIQRQADEAGKDAGAAARKTGATEKIGDTVDDVVGRPLRDTMRAIDAAMDRAAGVAKGEKDSVAENQMENLRSILKRAAFEKAKVEGVNVNAKVETPEFVSEAVASRFKKYQTTLNDLDTEVDKVLKSAGIEETAVVGSTYHQALKAAGTSVKNLNADLAKNPKLGPQIESELDRSFYKLIEDLHLSQADNQIKHTVVDELPGGALASTNRKTNEIKLRANLTKEEILQHVRGAIDSPVSAQKQVVLGQSEGLIDRLENMSLPELKQFILRHEFAHTKQDLSQYQSDTKQSMAEELGLGDYSNQYLSDSAIRLEAEANDAAIKGMDESFKVYNALMDSYNKVRADTEWAIIAHKERNAAQVALDPEWAQMSRDFVKTMDGDLDTLDGIYNSKFNKVLRNQFGGLSRSYAGELAASKTPLAQWAALHIFELPGGTGGKLARNETAAISMEMFNAKATHPVNAAWYKAAATEARQMKLNPWKSAVMRHSSAAADANANALGRKVQIEMNARQMGKQSDAEPHVKAYADELEKAYDYLYTVQHETGVQGITGQNKIKSYMHQAWSNDKLTAAFEEGNDNYLGTRRFKDLLIKSLKSRNPDQDVKYIDQEAQAFLDRILKNMNSTDEFDFSAVINDGDYINKRKLHVDLSTELDGISLLDFMSNDVTSDLHKYSKKASAMSAISRASNGKLNSADAIDSFIHATARESQEMGTHVDGKDLNNAFKIMMGEPITQFDPRARKIRDAVALSGMNGLGESQLAELGLAVNRGTAGLMASIQVVGKQFGKSERSSSWSGIHTRNQAVADDMQLLKEMQSVSTLYESMHNMARQNVHFDQTSGATTSASVKGLNKIVDTATGGKYRPVMQHVQTKYTGYGAIRTMQEQIAMASLMHDAGRILAGNKGFTTSARLRDIGLPMDMLAEKIKNGSIQTDSFGNIQKMNMDLWSKKEKHSLGVALRRHAAQQVQMGFAGEQSAMMNNPWVAFMMQFRSYPNIAAEKQQMRNAMFADKEAGMGLVLNGASSMAARVIRYQSLALALPEEKREAYLNRMYSQNLTKDTLTYMGGVGTMMNTGAIAMDPSEAVPPVVSWAGNYTKAIGGVGDGFSQRDVANITTAAPLGKIAQANLITGIIREAMQPTDSEPELRRSTRGN